MATIDDVDTKVNELDRKIGKSNRFAWIKDLLIPIAGLVLTGMAFIANKDANERQAKEAEAARQQKYLEYFLENFADESTNGAVNKQAAAFALLRYVDPDVRKDLVKSFSASTTLSDSAWQAILSLPNVEFNFGLANKYRLEIFFAPEQRGVAANIENQLKAARFGGIVATCEVPLSFWYKFGPPEGSEIRFEEGQDLIASENLRHYLKAKIPDLMLSKRAVKDSSRPTVVSIHLPPLKPLPAGLLTDKIMAQQPDKPTECSK